MSTLQGFAQPNAPTSDGGGYKRWKPEDQLGHLHIFANVSHEMKKRKKAGEEVMGMVAVCEYVAVLNPDGSTKDLFHNVFAFNERVTEQLPANASVCGWLTMGEKTTPTSRPYVIDANLSPEAQQQVTNWMAANGWAFSPDGRIQVGAAAGSVVPATTPAPTTTNPAAPVVPQEVQPVAAPQAPVYAPQPQPVPA